MAYQTPFLEAIKVRRSIVTLAKSSPISDQRIEMCVNHAIKHAPSPFNVQSCRAVILFGAEHDKLWDMAMGAARSSMPALAFAQFEGKIQGYRDGYGTVMFFEDTTAVEALPPPLQDLMTKFPEWYDHSQGMNQFIAWTALANEGLGCNLQHYQQMIGEDVKKTWDVPVAWKLSAQLVFGTPTGPPRGGEKEFKPLEERVKVFGK